MKTRERPAHSERDLLRWAAKAAGMDDQRWVEPGDLLPHKGGLAPSIGSNQTPVVWNPLIDDGDALRLAVKLRITPVQLLVGCRATSLKGADAYVQFGEEPYAATRLAIVRAAAEMGEAATAPVFQRS